MFKINIKILIQTGALLQATGRNVGSHNNQPNVPTTVARGVPEHLELETPTPQTSPSTQKSLSDKFIYLQKIN